ncbi:MAG: GspH/FimT family protein [Patescibacteria group bacterium]
MSAGFTLVELLLVLAIFLLVGVTVLPLYGNLAVTTQLNEETSQLVQTMRLARERSVVGLNAAHHGVCFEASPPADRYILYQGVDCTGRIVEYDRIVDLPPALRVSTTLLANDLNFNSLGAPLAAGSVTLDHEASGQRMITINELGLVEEN